MSRFYFISKSGLRLVVAFIIGMLVGASVITWWVGARIDYLMLQNEKLQATLDSKETQIQKLEDNLATEKRYVVKDMEVVISFASEDDEDSFVALSIEKQVLLMLDDLWGKEVRTLDPMLVANIIHHRGVEVDKKNYFLSVVRGPLISDKILVYVQVSKEKNSQPQEADTFFNL